MPRGGPDASWLDRRLQTDRLEYLDRDGADDLKRRVVRSLERIEKFSGTQKKFARIALDEVADVRDPNILELGAGHGGLSRALLAMHPTAQVTVTDIDPTFVASIVAGDLGTHPRAVVRAMDATAVDAPDGCYDLAIFALSLHHLPPPLAARVFAEGTRVAHKLLVIDLSRPPSMVHILRLSLTLPLAPILPLHHDGFISGLRAYSPSALRALAQYADPAIKVEMRGGKTFKPQIVVATRLPNHQASFSYLMQKEFRGVPKKHRPKLRQT
ncbi:methyltransferase type 11 [Mycobacterium sp. E2479]|nr:class I SAM-dependent methyltransferase [Mycobacterium sp. E2479]OBH63856.1 methyltransferase type 11 [Mycobacterium sp. E2479]